MLKPIDALQIRGNMYTLMTLVLQSTNHAEIATALHARILQAPAFLANNPVIVDFSLVEVPANYNFNLLFKVVRQQNLLPVAVRGLPEYLKDHLQASGVPVVEHNAPRSDSPSTQAAAIATDTTVGVPGETLVISRPLRPGERCYSRDADLVVVGDSHVNNELVADGHLHVYGVLRGHAVCGFQGNRDARIFCRELDASSVSVAGVGISKIPSLPSSGAIVQVRLKGDSLDVQRL